MTNNEIINQAISEIKIGKPIIILDDIKREHEGDLFIPAAFSTPEVINFMIKNAKGLMCAPLTPKIANKLSLEPMVKNPTDILYTPFTFSVDSKDNKTGISAFERFDTIKKLCDPKSTFEDFTVPGHMFPLIGNEKGVLERPGHTEAAIDMCKLSNVYEVGVIQEILNDDGTMARTNDLEQMSKDWGLSLITINQIRQYLLENKV